MKKTWTISHNIKTTGAAIALGILLTACNSLSVANYDRLRMGMSYEEVRDIVGKTDSCNEQLGTRTCVWGDENKQIKVVFVANKATLFSHKGIN